MGRKNIVPELEKKLGSPLKPWLTARINEGKTPEEISKLLEIGKSKVYEIVKEFGLKDMIKASRKQKESGGGGELKFYLDKYIDEKRMAGLSKKTISKDVTAFRLYLWWLENFHKPLDLNGGFNKDTLGDYLIYLAAQTNRFGRQFKKPVSDMGRVSYLKQFIAFDHWLKKQDIRKESFTEKMRKIKVPRTLPEDIPDIVIDKILGSYGNSFLDVRDKTIFSWFLETGQRLGGVAAIRLANFDWEKGQGIVIEKGRKERTIVLSKMLLSQVKKYLEVREPIAKCDYLWINPKGQPLDNFVTDPPTYHGTYKIFSNLDKKFRADMEKYSIKPGQSIHPHAMRHVWAKHLAQAEVPLFSIMVMAGWENLDLVQRYARAYTQETAWKYINTASPLSQKSV